MAVVRKQPINRNRKKKQPKKPGDTTVQPVPTPDTPTSSQVTYASQDLQAILDYFGLGGLFADADAIIQQYGSGILQNGDVFISYLRDNPVYKQRFSGNEARRAKGLPELSPASYVAIEQEYKNVLRANGMPVGFYDTQQDMANFIGRDLNPNEINTRIQQGYRRVMTAEPGVVNELKNLYGLNDGEIAAFFLDEQRTMDAVTQKASAAFIGYQARQQAQLQLTAQEAEALAQAGVEGQAAQGFEAIQNLQELFRGAPGEDQITREEQIGGVFGTNAAAAQRIRKRQAERTARFEAGGSFAGQGGSVTGLQ